MLRLTRRQAAIAFVAATVGGAGLYGRYLVGDEFEAHVAERLGVDLDFARELLVGVHEAVGLDYDARAASFLLATTAPSRWMMPRGAREEAIEALIEPMFAVARNPGSAYHYAGLRPDSRFRPCRMLIRQ